MHTKETSPLCPFSLSPLSPLPSHSPLIPTITDSTSPASPPFLFPHLPFSPFQRLIWARLHRNNSGPIPWRMSPLLIHSPFITSQHDHAQFLHSFSIYLCFLHITPFNRSAVEWITTNQISHILLLSPSITTSTSAQPHRHNVLIHDLSEVEEACAMLWAFLLLIVSVMSLHHVASSSFHMFSIP